MSPVVLSGGSGTRLWPVSRKNLPKQFCSLFEKPLQTSTLLRSAPLGAPWIITSKTLQTLTEKNLNENNLENVQVVYEPFSKNTAPAVAVLCRLLQLRGLTHEVAAIFPADHLVRNEDEFQRVLQFATKIAESGRIVTLGIEPSYPETGYGYIQTSPRVLMQTDLLQAFEVQRFHEKPSLDRAKEFIAQGGYVWNSGIFVFKIAKMIEAFEKYQPEMWNQILNLKGDLSNFDEIYQKVQSLSIDHAIIENLSSLELASIPCDFGWSDVGSWDAVSDLAQGREVLNVKAEKNFVFGNENKKYSIIGVDDVILVDTQDALMLIKRGQSQQVKQVVEEISKSTSPILKDHNFEYRPWGYFEILKDSDHFKSKMIRVNAFSQLSYQSHEKRAEHWTITQGVGEVVLDDQVIPVQSGSHVFIPRGAKHRIRNTSCIPLEFVEVQIGTYFGEDDIVRYQDDYRRI
jgi:mannose-1-phosphate guanylyltransferase/mannose-6-phosphate isomerase